jgi:hypothetical protein
MITATAECSVMSQFSPTHPLTLSFPLPSCVMHILGIFLLTVSFYFVQFAVLPGKFVQSVTFLDVSGSNFGRGSDSSD